MVSRGRKQGIRVSAVAAVAVLCAAVFPAMASAGCPSATLSQPFQQFDDISYYQLAPGGSFESGVAGWTAPAGLLGLGQTSATVVSENESYNLVPGTHSLVVAPYGNAVSPWVCISSEYPTFRFFARQPGGASSSPMTVGLRWINVLGVVVDTSAGSLSSYGSWAPSPIMKLGDSVPLWLPGSTAMVQLVFHANAAPWTVDDVYLDPYRR